ncbi:MAG: DUF1636 domain-containing protein [Arenicellales bacterium]|nr:DUF1636 domain-containing protein [Arenicellales bacterium]
MTRLYVCQTCVRDRRLAPDERSQGSLLGDAVDETLGRMGLSSELALRRVNCLNGCLNPCNIALRAPDKYNLRFSRLTPQSAASLVQFAIAYMQSSDGIVPVESWPDELKGNQTVCTPPPRSDN